MVFASLSPIFFPRNIRQELCCTCVAPCGETHPWRVRRGHWIGMVWWSKGYCLVFFFGDRCIDICLFCSYLHHVSFSIYAHIPVNHLGWVKCVFLNFYQIYRCFNLSDHISQFSSLFSGWWFVFFNLFFHILDTIIPTDSYFSEGWNHQPDTTIWIHIDMKMDASTAVRDLPWNQIHLRHLRHLRCFAATNPDTFGLFDTAAFIRIAWSFWDPRSVMNWIDPYNSLRFKPGALQEGPSHWWRILVHKAI